MIIQVKYLHWVGNVSTIIRIISGNLCLPKVTRKENASFRETLERSWFIALRLLRRNLLESEIVLLKIILRQAW